jgi:hypothetical protein
MDWPTCVLIIRKKNSSNLQSHEHAASMVDCPRQSDFGGRVIEIKAAQLINVRE